MRRVAEYAQRMTDHEFFSHVSAAIIWGLPMPPSAVAARPLDVCVHRPRRAPDSRDVHGTTVVARLARVVQHPASGVRVTSPASTWAMLGAVLVHPYDLIAVGDAIARVRMHDDDPAPLAGLAQLGAVVDAGRRVGVAHLRAALPRISERSRSRPETWLRLLIEDAGLPAPRVNFDVIERGVWLGQVDLAFPERRVALEYEGEHHLTDPAQWAKDIARYERFIEAGWRVIRVTKGDVFGDSREMLARVCRALDAARR